MLTVKVIERKKDFPSCSNTDAPTKNHFYALQSPGYTANSPNVVTSMLQVFSIDVYALLDNCSGLFYLTSFVYMMF